MIDHADQIDLDRPAVDLLTFGKGGPHFCMGSFLAKMELRVTLEELVASRPDHAFRDFSRGSHDAHVVTPEPGGWLSRQRVASRFGHRSS